MTKRRRAEGRAGRRRAPIGKKSPGGGFAQRYYRLILALVLIVTVASGVGEYCLSIKSGSTADFQESLDKILTLGACTIISLLGRK